MIYGKLCNENIVLQFSFIYESTERRVETPMNNDIIFF